MWKENNKSGATTSTTSGQTVLVPLSFMRRQCVPLAMGNYSETTTRHANNCSFMAIHHPNFMLSFNHVSVHCMYATKSTCRDDKFRADARPLKILAYPNSEFVTTQRFFVDVFFGRATTPESFLPSASHPFPPVGSICFRAGLPQCKGCCYHSGVCFYWTRFE